MASINRPRVGRLAGEIIVSSGTQWPTETTTKTMATTPTPTRTQSKSELSPNELDFSFQRHIPPVYLLWPLPVRLGAAEEAASR